MTDQFVEVTEIEGQQISLEQLDRTCHRYHWASKEVAGLEVLEVACGSGLGLELLLASASRVEAGDFSPAVLAIAKELIGERINLIEFSAEKIPFPDNSLDAVLIFEALYYVPDPDRFFAEARRVLRPGGKLLIVVCNKDLFDFNPSPYTSQYLGVQELTERLSEFGFEATFGGYTDISKTSLRQRLLRPVKAAASRLGLIPKTMLGKGLLKKLFFGEMTTMPRSVAGIPFDYSPPTPISPAQPDKRHKVIYCTANLAIEKV